MVGVVARYGETGASPYLMPFSVDGLMVVASICLVEIGAQLRVPGQAPAGESGPMPDESTSDTYVSTPVRPNGYAIGSGVVR